MIGNSETFASSSVISSAVSVKSPVCRTGVRPECFRCETGPIAADVVGVHIGIFSQDAAEKTTVDGTVRCESDSEFLQSSENFRLGLPKHQMIFTLDGGDRAHLAHVELSRQLLHSGQNAELSPP
jgi:hypothetical protein